MGHCTLTDLEGSITAARVAELCKAEGVAVAVARVIVDATAEIDLHETGAWSADAKRACAVALAVEGLYGRHGTGKIPRVHADRAAVWRMRLETAGQKSSKQGTWTSIAFDPILRETEQELQRLRTGV